MRADHGYKDVSYLDNHQLYNFYRYYRCITEFLVVSKLRDVEAGINGRAIADPAYLKLKSLDYFASSSHLKAY